MRQRDDVRCDDHVMTASRDRGQWIRNARCCVAARIHHDEGARRFDHIAPDPARNPLERVLRERLLALENARTRNRPVDALGSSAPRMRAPFAVCWFGPYDRLTVAARDKEQALPDRWRTVVARPELAVFHNVPESAKPGSKAPERIATTQLVRHPIGAEWPPCLKLLDVLQNNHTRFDGLRPPARDPRESANLLRDRLPALRLREMLAVGREPHEPNRTACACRNRIHRPDVLAVVLCARMVGRVHRYRFAVVVDRDVRRAARRHLDTE